MRKNYFLSMLIILFATLITQAQTNSAKVGNSGSGGPFTGTWTNNNDGFYYALESVRNSGQTDLVIYLSGTFTVGFAHQLSNGATYVIEGDGSDTTIIQGMTDTEFSNGDIKEKYLLDIFDNSNVTFSNLTLKNTRSNTKEAAVKVSDATTTFTNVQFKDNYHTGLGDPGGLSFANCTTATIDSCIFDNNSGKKGSAIYAYTTGAAMDLTVENSTFKNNVSTVGDGAVFMWTSNTTNPFNATFGRNVFFNNTGASGAGAIGVQGNITSVNLINNTIAYNTAQHGIILYGDYTSLIATNNLLYDNSAGYDLALSDTPTGTRNINNNFIRSFQETDLVNGETSNILNTADAFLAATLTDNHLVPSEGSAVFDAGIEAAPYTNGINALEITIGAFQDDVTMSDEVIWTGDTDTDWATPGNWSLGEVPTATDNVTIPTGTGNNPIINATTGAVANNITTNDVLTITSGGSLIVGGTSTGNVTHNRNLTFMAGNSEGWHLVGSPVVGQAYNDTYVTANSIASGTGSNRGIATYDNSVASSNWSYLQSAGAGTFDAAVGYSLKTSATTDVSFTGTLNTEDVDKAINVGSGTPFNLISNPFTSYLNSGSFLTANTAVLTSETIWLWNPSTKNYDAKVTGDSFEVAPGQGFFVSCGTAGNVTFDADNQSHQTDTFLRSASKSEITLNMTDGDVNRYARIYYNNSATVDFDNGYDGETFSGVANTFDVFTQLIGNNVGKNYQVQALPNTDLASMVIPVGLKAKANKEITFSAEAMNLPTGIKVFLEDRVHNTFTRLDEANATYKVTLGEALDGVGLFYIHTTQSALSDDNVTLTGVSVFKANAATLRVTGLQQGKASLSLYNVLGKQLMSNSFEATASKDISLPKLARGIYFVKVQTATGALSKKIILE